MAGRGEGQQCAVLAVKGAPEEDHWQKDRIMASVLIPNASPLSSWGSISFLAWVQPLTEILAKSLFSGPPFPPLKIKAWDLLAVQWLQHCVHNSEAWL